jgi:hypothetical protein
VTVAQDQLAAEFAVGMSTARALRFRCASIRGGTMCLIIAANASNA